MLRGIKLSGIPFPVSRTNQMKTTYGTKIHSIISVYDGIATCAVGSEIVQIHISNIIR